MSKLFMSLYNHFKARQYLRKAREFLKDFPDLVKDKLLIRYRDAKCNYYAKLSIIPKLEKNSK